MRLPRQSSNSSSRQKCNLRRSWSVGVPPPPEATPPEDCQIGHVEHDDAGLRMVDVGFRCAWSLSDQWQTAGVEALDGSKTRGFEQHLFCD
eukprot:COSAG01_NODE_639_length_14598_cov_316.689841_8_plen_91_part_00